MFSQASIAIDFPVSYELEITPGATQGLLVLHGFSDHARAARRRLLGKTSPPGFTLLAPNALFPSPVKEGDGYKEAYSWYFRDPKTGVQLTTPEFAATVLLRLISDLKLGHLTWTILGFSQGGFFAPYLVRAGLNAPLIITSGAAFRPEAYQDLPPVRIHAIHGQDDAILDHQLGKSSFEGIQKMGYGVKFHSFPGLGHTLHEEGRALIRELIATEPPPTGPIAQ
jgi:predicted esterase